MSAIVGERDRALRATFPRNINPTAGKTLLLEADPPAAHFSYDGTPTTPTITFTAKTVGFDATVLWSITSGGVLAGSGKNVRTMAASSMTSAEVRVIATVVFEGEAYIATKTIFKLTDGAPADDTDPVDLSPEALVALLEGRITESALYADLRSKINLITDPVSVPGSVQAQVKVETDGRVAAIQQEIDDRLAAAFAQAQSTDAFIRSYAYSKVESDASEAIQASQIAASFTSYANAASADVRNYAYSKSAIDNAEALQSSTLTTNYTAYADAARASAVSTASADVRAYSYSKSDTTSAIAAAESRLRSEFVGSGGATEAYVTNYAYSKSQIDQAEALQSSTLTAGYTNAVNGIQIGGRNLYSRTQTFTDPTASGTIFAERLSDGFTLVGVSGETGFMRMAVPLAVGPYTLSFNLRLRDGPGILWLDLADTATQVINATTTDTHHELHFNVTNASLPWLDFNKMGSQGYYFTKFMLVSGNKAFDYMPAPEDVAGDIAGAIVIAAADVRQYAYAKSDAAGAFASLSSTITAAYQTYTDNGKAAAIAASAADIRNYSYSKAEANTAIAQSTTQLTSTVGSHTTTLQTQATSIDGLSAQMTVKIDNNGRISGYGLASTPIDGVVYSIFAINADAFSVGAPGVANKQMFTVGQVNGQTAMVLRGDALIDGAITARTLKVGSSDNILPDPQFRDLAWWGRAGIATVSQWSDAGQITGWKGGSSMYLTANAGIVETNTSAFQMTPGATYLIEVQVSISNDWNGRLGVYMLIAGVQWYPMIQGSAVAATGQTWANNGLPVSLNSGNPTKNLITCSSTYVVPGAGATYASTCIKIMSSFTAGSCEIGSVSITRVSDSVLIADGAVTANKLKVGRVGNTGAGVEIDKFGERVYDENSMKRFQSGNLDV